MPNGFTIFGFKIYFYGILIMLGALAAAYMAMSQAKKRGQNPDVIWDMFAWVLIGGIVGARIWHILTPPPSMVAQGITTMYYFTHPLEMLRFRAGGLGIPGGVIGGGLALYIFTHIKKLNFGMWADFAAPGLALAQAIGRWGNFFNQEVYGKPSTLPWAIEIDPEYRLPEFSMFSTYHPLFLYECIWNLLNMGLLLYLGKRFEKWLKNGDVFLVYLMMYGLGRFLLEFVRLDSSRVAGINANQTVAAIVALASAGFFLWRHSKYAESSKEKPAIDEMKAAKAKTTGVAAEKSITANANTTAKAKTATEKAKAAKTPIKTVEKATSKKSVKTSVKSAAKTTARKTVPATKTKPPISK
jgi:phosphatidylglycerol:prolipoprotein diacylglycerol transferase